MRCWPPVRTSCRVCRRAGRDRPGCAESAADGRRRRRRAAESPGGHGEHRRGTVLECTFSKRIARQEVAVWAPVVLFDGCGGGFSGWIGRIIHRGKEQAAVRTLRPPADPAEARLRLAELVELVRHRFEAAAALCAQHRSGYAANHGRGRPEQVLERAILDSGAPPTPSTVGWTSLGDRAQERPHGRSGRGPGTQRSPPSAGVARRIWEPILAAQRS